MKWFFGHLVEIAWLTYLSYYLYVKLKILNSEVREKQLLF